MSYSNLKIFLPDTIHFHERNFKSLFDFFSRHDLKITKNNDINSWSALYGDYKSKEKELSPYSCKIKTLSTKDKLNFTYKGKNIWGIARAELLSYFLPKIEYNIFTTKKDDIQQLELMSKVCINTVVNCFSATMYFIDYWKKKLESIQVHNYALIFSGSQIYNRTLLETLKHSQTTPVVMEHFFTGNEYYFEERYTPIANSSDLKHLYINNDKNNNDNDRKRIKAINKVLLSKNRNVKKTGNFLHLDFTEGKTVALIGQVVNDFSIIETANEYLNPIYFYKDFIEKSIKSGLNVVFKAHPWEHKKNNVKNSFTKNMILAWAQEELTKEERNKLVITEDSDISSLFLQADYVAGLCSQGLLESVFHGFKPLQFGNAFFGGYGFTNDYNNIDSFIKDVKEKNVEGTLNLSEYIKYEDFMVTSLEGELVSIHKSGILSLESKLRQYPLIPLVENKKPIISKKIHNELEEMTIEKVEEISRTMKKLKKLKKQPKTFFKDSKYSILRKLTR
ncbi:hypothetical protein [uncultured Shewanella sp.]|uniref:capsular polysaccharide export protein, LipB/KpsS family n=1 Tax=uncultured Shewanella sp. TaxID=173975 RepID=UPI00260D6727|nr:hypothetical protein [uncultured Shewanella sp.]